jgi:hypothetical protein
MRVQIRRRSIAGFVLLGVLATGLGIARAGSPERDAVDGAPAPRGLMFSSSRDNEIEATSCLENPNDVGNVRLVVSNSGTFGTAFSNRETPSMEWPARSGIDHLVRGAVWVGAISAASGDTLVSIGGRDASFTEGICANSEWTGVSGRPVEFSRLRTSPFYRRGTVSDENLHTVYVDSVLVPRAGAEPPHRPLGVRVVQETYTWGFDPLDDFVIVEINIVNTGSIALQDAWVGIYSELVTNDRHANWPTWPPGGRWFDFKTPHWDAERHMLVNHNSEHRFVGPDIRAAIKVLGTGGHGPYRRGPDSLATKRISLTAWNWSPTQFQTWTDDSLYQRMSTGRITNLDSTIFSPGPDADPVSVLSVGPFPLLAPGDTTQVVFAFIAAENQADLEKNAFWAQKAYNDKYALPSPPSPPKVRVYPRHNEIVLRWNSAPETELDPATHLPDFQGYRIYLSESPLAAQFHLAQQYDVRDGVGFDTGLDAVRLPQPYIDGPDTLQYEAHLTGIPDGQKRYVAITSYDFQQGVPPTLESGVLTNSIYCIAGPDAAQARGHKVSVFPNPYRGESAFDGRDAQGGLNPRKRILWFVNLPSRSRVRIYTLAGDLVRSYDYDASTYRGTEAQGIKPDNADLSQGRYVVTGGTMVAFDLLSENRQEIATGLYLFSVEDLTNGETQQGKFLVLK